MSAVGAFLAFTTSSAGGAFCGNTQDGSAVVIKNLTCGGLNLGGGGSVVPEGLTPDGATSLFALSCTGSSCTIGPTSIAPPVNRTAPDCTDVGCNFGTPLPIPNPMIPTSSLCVLNTWSVPASGTLDLASGTSSTDVALNSDVYLTGNQAQPCPKCSATGTPSSPGTGTCDRGPRAGMTCTTTSSTGVTRDCPTGGIGSVATPCPGGSGAGGCPANDCRCTPGGGSCCDGAHLGAIPIDLSPLTTGNASDTDPGGLFCPGQTGAGAGCFGSTACRTITENGVAAGPLTTDIPASATLASVFCIAATGDGFVDNTFGLPGPGAVALPGTFLVHSTLSGGAVCGNNVIEAGEVCDCGIPPCAPDRSLSARPNSGGCPNAPDGSWQMCAPDCSACLPSPRCANGILDPGDTCDYLDGSQSDNCAPGSLCQDTNPCECTCAGVGQLCLQQTPCCSGLTCVSSVCQ